MARIIISQNDFTAGEISPRLYNRTDTTEYKKALNTATNVNLLPQGPVVRRNGSQFIAQTKDNSKKVRLVPYQVNQDTAFLLEFGDSYIRFFKDSAQLLESDKTITDITQANPAVVTSNSHGYSNGDHVYITSVTGMTEINNSTIPYKVANKTANTFELQDVDGNNIDSSGFTAYSSGGTANKIYEITSPWDDTEVQNIQYVQRGTTMYIVHPDHAPRTLIRNSDTDWDLATLSFSPPPTYESGFEPAGTVTPAATTGVDKTFTASSSVFVEGDVGRQIINLTDGETGRASITSVDSATQVTCDIVEDFTDTNAIANGDWKLDLSPIADLEPDGIQAGSVINIRAKHISGELGPRKDITDVTQDSTGVVTSNGHGYSNGDKVLIEAVEGMTQLNGNIYTVGSATTNTFELRDDNNDSVNTTTYTAYSTGGIARKDLSNLPIDAFRSADVGKYILLNGGVVEVLTVNAANDIDCFVHKTLNSDDTTGNWTLETDTWTSARGYPRAVGLYKERLVFGGTATQPQNLWFSEVGIFDGFGTGPDDEDSIAVEIVSNEVNRINWLIAARDLVVGTSGGELTINSGGSATFGPSNISQTPRTSYGSDVQQVNKLGNEVIFFQKSTRKLRTFRYDFNIDNYSGEDLTFLSDHLTEDGLKEVAWAQEPDSSLYIVTDGGDLLVGIYDRSKKLIGWTKFETDGNYENTQTISKDNIDQVWTVVKRTINSQTRRHIELFDTGNGEDDTDGFSDSFLTLSDNKTITNITQANPAVVTANSHGFADGDTVIIKDLVDPPVSDLDADKTNMSTLNGDIFKVANKTANTFELNTLDDANVDTSNFNAYSSGGNAWKRVTALSGLDHLEGKTVQVKGDGAVQPTKTVSNGAITAQTAAGEFVVGLPYTTTIKTLHIDFDIGMGSMVGQRAKWTRPLLRVYKSGKPTLNGEFLPARSTADELSQKIGLFSGFLEYGNLDWNNTTAVTLEISDPLPLQLTGISGTIDSGVK